MKKRLISLLLPVALLIGLVGVQVAGIGFETSVFAAPKDEACAAIGGCSGGGMTVNNIVRFILNTLSIVAGVIAVIMVIWAGIKYMTSQGDGNAIATAKKTLLYALIGLVIVALSQFLVRFVLTNVSRAGGGQQTQNNSQTR